MRLNVYLIVGLLLLSSACAPTETSTRVPTQVPTQESTQVPEQPSEDVDFHPLDTRTGIAGIDSILAAVESGEPQKLSALINYTIAPCTTADGLGGPPKCAVGEAEGTEIEVLPFLGGEGSFIRKSEIGNWQGIEASGIYSIYRIADDATVEQYYPAGEYVILLMAPENQPAIALRVVNDGVVRIDYVFDSSPEALINITQQNAVEVILPPVIR